MRKIPEKSSKIPNLRTNCIFLKMTDKGASKRLANLIIAGVNKAGSTSLFHYLAEHPDICGSSDKETCYFLPLLYNEPLAPIKDYESQFQHCLQSRYRLEATPGYLYAGEKIANAILSTVGLVHVIVILKNPVDRLISFYTRKKATFQLPKEMELGSYVEKCMSLSEKELALHENQIYTGVIFGKYSDFIEPWLNKFGDQLKVIFFDDLKNDTPGLMKDLATWLNIDPSFYDTFNFDIKNRSNNFRYRFLHRIAVGANETGRKLWRSNPGLKKLVLNTYYAFNGTPFKKEEFPDEVIDKLYRHFKPYNQKLNSILHRHGYHQLPAWIGNESVTA
jgi:hypothetical protein